MWFIIILINFNIKASQILLIKLQILKMFSDC